MEFLIAGLLVLDLAVTLVSVQLLERESRRQFIAVREEIAKTTKLQKEAIKILRELARQLEDSPSLLGQEEESALSKAMEEGISNILGFSAGRTSEGRT